MNSEKSKNHDTVEKHYNFLKYQRNNKILSSSSTNHNYSTVNKAEKVMTTATSMTNDEQLLSNFNSNRSLLLKNPPTFYHP